MHSAHNTYVETTDPLIDGLDYLVLVDGNHTVWDSNVQGAWDALIYPSPGGTYDRGAHDADTIYAREGSDQSGLPSHTTVSLLWNRGDGWVHLEPEGGPYSAPVAGHAYTYRIRGLGSKLRAAITDTPLIDNNGMYRVRFYGEFRPGWKIGSIPIA